MFTPWYSINTVYLIQLPVGSIYYNDRYFRMTLISNKIIENEIDTSLNSYHYPNFIFNYISYFNSNTIYGYHFISLCDVVHVKYYSCMCKERWCLHGSLSYAGTRHCLSSLHVCTPTHLTGVLHSNTQLWLAEREGFLGFCL